ncbi:MAG: hypothetical protein R3F48_14410 [Candidatus Zixiibacteriota bacterium]
MKTKFASVVIVLFAFSFFFSLGINTALADYVPEYCLASPLAGVPGSCCVVNGIPGVWSKPYGILYCDCSGWNQGETYINPCNCDLGCPIQQ